MPSVISNGGDPPSKRRAPALPDRVIHVGLWLSVVALASGLSLQRIRSFDYWFHLKIGELIATTRSIPMVDVFSYTAAGNRYIDVHWLYQLGLHGLFRAGGHEAVVLAKLVLVLATLSFMLAASGRRDRPAVTVFALALGMATLSDRIMPRPELPTFALLAAVLALLERFRRKPDRWVYAIVGLQLVWANVHGLFAVGIGAIGIFLVGEAIDAFRSSRWSSHLPRVRRLGFVALLSLFVSLVNPNGLDAALYPFMQFLMIGSSEMRASVGLNSLELGSLPSLWQILDPTMLVAFAVLAFASAASLMVNWPRARSADVLLVLVFLGLAFMAVRNMGLFGVVAPPVLARNLNEWLGQRSLRPVLQRWVGATLSITLLVLAALVASGHWALQLGQFRESGLGILDGLYPIGAAEWIARERPSGPLYHHPVDGGYLMWRLHPEYPVMADGRLEVYGDKMAQLSGISPNDFLALDEEYHFETALLSYNWFAYGPLMIWMKRRADWHLAYADAVSVVFVRKSPEDGVRSDRAVKPSTAFEPHLESRSVSDLIRRNGRVRFLKFLGQQQEARRQEVELRRRYPAFFR